MTAGKNADDDYAGRIDREMARQLQLIGRSLDSDTLRTRFTDYATSAWVSGRSASTRPPGNRRRRALLIALCIDLLSALVAVAAVGSWRYRHAAPHGMEEALAITLACVPPGWMVALWLRGVYHSRRLDLLEDRGVRLLRAAALLGAVIALGNLLVGTRDSALTGFAAVAGACLLAISARGLVGRWARSRHLGRRRAVLLGDAASIIEFAGRVRPGRMGNLQIVGASLTDIHDAGDLGSIPYPVLGGVDTVLIAARDVPCDLVILLRSGSLESGALQRLSWQLNDIAVDLALMPLLTDIAPWRISVGATDDMPVVEIRPTEPTTVQHALKYVLDRLLAAVLLVVLAPMMLGVAITVRLTSPGPVFFRQTRVGLRGRQFTSLKFRTMVAKAEKMEAQLAHLNEKRDGILFKISDDPRLTRVGKVLRRYSLDELPQLINVLVGSMSMVGPRAPTPDEAAQYDEAMARKFKVRPGLTGLWQVSGRRSLPWHEAVRLDQNYVDNWSLGMDLRILWRTISAVISGVGAY